MIEVKKNSLPPGHGLDQAKGYAKAQRLNVPYVYSTNGYMFVEFDRQTGQTRVPRTMAEFPSPADLRARYEAAMGFSLDLPAAAPLLRPYKGGEGAAPLLPRFRHPSGFREHRQGCNQQPPAPGTSFARYGVRGARTCIAGTGRKSCSGNQFWVARTHWR